MYKGKTAAFYTLGCKLNFSETSTISRQLSDIGFTKTDFHEGADIFVINTCSVTENANKECKRIIRQAKKNSPDSFVVVTGCFAQLKPLMIAEMEGVDMVLGANEKFNLTNLLSDLTNKIEPEIYGCDLNNLEYASSFSLSERTRAFLKIQDGCDYKCTYCTIPLARGVSRCDTISNILLNAEEIAKSGKKEIVITGVNIGEYIDPITNKKFYDLIKQLDKVEGIERYRISSIEPNLISKEIIKFVKTSKKFTPHFHIPLQSGSNDILGKMRRRYNTDIYKSKIEQITSSIENTCIGADIIVGFPGETDTHFLETLHFIKELPISYLHVFPYSERENTEAVLLKNSVKKEIRNERSRTLRILSKKLIRKYYEKFLGTKQSILFERENKGGFLYGFTENYIKVKIPFSEDIREKMKEGTLVSFDKEGNINAKIEELCIQQ